MGRNARTVRMMQHTGGARRASSGSETEEFHHQLADLRAQIAAHGAESKRGGDAQRAPSTPRTRNKEEQAVVRIQRWCVGGLGCGLVVLGVSMWWRRLARTRRRATTTRAGPAWSSNRGRHRASGPVRVLHAPIRFKRQSRSVLMLLRVQNFVEEMARKRAHKSVREILIYCVFLLAFTAWCVQYCTPAHAFTARAGASGP